MSELEIERVFLLDRMPELSSDLLSSAELWHIDQGYFPPASESPSEGESAPIEGRIRRIRRPDHSEQFIHTVKSGLGLVREETERTLTHEEFQTLWPQTEGRRLRKTRMRIHLDGQCWELDEFLDLGRDLALAEAELPSPETPLVPPPWLEKRILREVTDDPRFRNFHLASKAGILDLPDW